MNSFPQFRVQGDGALLVYLGQGIDPALNARVRALAARLRDRPLDGLREVTPAYCCLQVAFDPRALGREEIKPWVGQALAGLPEAPPDSGRTITVPVVYGGQHGPDLEFVAQHTGLSPAQVIARHTGGSYLCYLVGFSPGFPFLGGLPPELRAPRLETPRSSLAPGAVGLAQTQTGFYPLGGPGGWRIIGRTPLLTFDPLAQPPALIQAGDQVRFQAVSQADFPPLPPPAGDWDPRGQPVLQVLKPGAYSTVQDQGRWGFSDQGVPISGALDQLAAAAANALVGNRPEQAALEMTLLGPTLKALAPITLAMTGAEMDLRLNGRPAPAWTSLSLKPEDLLQVGMAQSGARGYLALAGGVASLPVMGSRSAYPAGRLGATLAPDQAIAAYPGQSPPGLLQLPPEHRPALGQETVLRVLPGPQDDHFTAQGLQSLFSARYRLSTQADRRGLRLEGPAVPLKPGGPASIVSEPNVPGVVQVPADGAPIILLREQTVGGYAKVATVISADLDRLAQLRPGDPVRFKPVDLAQARAAAGWGARTMAGLGDLLRPAEPWPQDGQGG